MCLAERQDSACEAFITGDYDFVENTRSFGCLNDSTLFFQWKFPSLLFFGNIKNGRMKIESVISMGTKNSTRVKWEQYVNLAVHEYQRLINESSNMTITATEKREYKFFQAFITYFYGISETEFEQQFYKQNKFQALFKSFQMYDLLFKSDYGVYLKDDTTFFVGVPSIFDANCVGTMSINGGNVQKHFCYSTFDCCGRLMNTRVQSVSASDSTIRIDYMNGDWLIYDAKKDEIRFSMNNALNDYRIEHYSTDGDTLVYKNFVPVMYCPGARYRMFGECVLE